MPFKPMQHTDGRDVPFTSVQLRELAMTHGVCPAGPAEAISKHRYWQALIGAGIANRLLDEHYKLPGSSPGDTPPYEPETMPMEPMQPPAVPAAVESYPLTKAGMVSLLKRNNVAVGDYDRKTIAALWQMVCDNGLEPAAREAQPAAAPAVPAAAPVASGDAMAQLVGALNALGIGSQKPFTPEQLAEAVRVELAKQEPVKQYIVIRDKVEHQVPAGEYVRPEVERALAYLAQGRNVLFVGPAGTGKSHMAEQLAGMLGVTYTSNSCSAGMSESALAGWLLPIAAGGAFDYVPAPFITSYEQGGLHNLDELDAMDANLGVFVNQALGNRRFHLPQRFTRTLVERAPNSYIVACANTYGNGGSRIYVGREQLDKATLDRFWIIDVDYDHKLEAQLCLPEVLEWANTLRAKVNELKLREVVSTRKMIDASVMVKAGMTLKQVKADFFAGWATDARAKVGA